MATVLDVAAYILRKQGRMSTWKLQKLVYYSQAWFLVWEDTPLFEEPIQAWANGPVVRELYEKHAGKFQIAALPEGDPNALSADQKTCIDVVLNDYGHRSGQWLSELAHMEAPWKDARARCHCAPGQHCDGIIGQDAMALYYGGLLEAAVQ